MIVRRCLCRLFGPARLGIALGALLACFPAAPALAADSPAAALADIQGALDAADLPRFERRVDVDALTRQGSGIFMDLLRDARHKDGVPLPPALSLLAGAAESPQTAPAMQGLLAGEAASFVRDGVASGRFSGRAEAAGASRGLFGSLFAGVSPGRKTLRAAGGTRAVPTRGGAVDLPVVVHDAGNGQDYAVTLRLERAAGPQGREGLWKVTRIADLPDIAARLWQEALPAQETAPARAPQGG